MLTLVLLLCWNLDLLCSLFLVLELALFSEGYFLDIFSLVIFYEKSFNVPVDCLPVVWTCWEEHLLQNIFFQDEWPYSIWLGLFCISGTRYMSTKL